MTENIPPASASDSTRGVPYYEKLKRDLRETLAKKSLLDKKLADLEDQIYRQETAYLEDTSAGNIIRGFDNYIKSSSTAVSSLPSSASVTAAAAGGGGVGGGGAGGGGTASRRKSNVLEQDRVFSRSSTAFAREVSPVSSPQVESQGVTPTSGVMDTGTPVGGGGRKGDKKKKGPEKGDGEDEGGEKGPKRLKITYARGAD